MRLLNIASGSSGNATYIGNSGTHILVDTGISKKRITEGLHLAEIGLNDIDAILITHEHADHIKSLGVLERARPVPVYATKETIREIKKCRELGDFQKDVFVEIDPGVKFTVGDISVTPIGISHDAAYPVCYRFDCAGSKKSAAIVTDLGCAGQDVIRALSGLDIIMLEANHDVRMLEAGSYPYYLKQRILGKKGHLSNECAGQLLAGLLHDNIKEIMLAHVSRENNTRELARISVEAEIDMADNKYRAKDFNIHVARHDIPSEILGV